MYGGMMDLYEAAEQPRKEMVREAEPNRLTKRLRTPRKGHSSLGQASILIWGLGSDVGRLPKVLKISEILLLALAILALRRES